MPKRTKTKNLPVLPHSDKATLPNGKTLTYGEEFSVKGEGRFKFLYVWEPDGSVVCYGPVGKQTAQMRSFLTDRITTVHRKKVQR